MRLEPEVAKNPRETKDYKNPLITTDREETPDPPVPRGSRVTLAMPVPGETRGTLEARKELLDQQALEDSEDFEEDPGFADH